MGRPRGVCYEEVEEMFHDGKSVREMSDRLNLPVYAVYNRLKTLGLKITERDRDLPRGSVQGTKKKKGRPARHDGTERYNELEKIVQRHGAVTIEWDGLDYTAILRAHEGAPMRNIEAAIDSARAVAQEDQCEAS